MADPWAAYATSRRVESEPGRARAAECAARRPLARRACTRGASPPLGCSSARAVIASASPARSPPGRGAADLRAARTRSRSSAKASQRAAPRAVHVRAKRRARRRERGRARARPAIVRAASSRRRPPRDHRRGEPRRARAHEARPGRKRAAPPAVWRCGGGGGVCGALRPTIASAASGRRRIARNARRAHRRRPCAHEVGTFPTTKPAAALAEGNGEIWSRSWTLRRHAPFRRGATLLEGCVRATRGPDAPPSDDDILIEEVAPRSWRPAPRRAPSSTTCGARPIRRRPPPSARSSAPPPTTTAATTTPSWSRRSRAPRARSGSARAARRLDPARAAAPRAPPAALSIRRRDPGRGGAAAAAARARRPARGRARAAARAATAAADDDDGSEDDILVEQVEPLAAHSRRRRFRRRRRRRRDDDDDELPIIEEVAPVASARRAARRFPGRGGSRRRGRGRAARAEPRANLPPAGGTAASRKRIAPPLRARGDGGADRRRGDHLPLTSSSRRARRTSRARALPGCTIARM